MKGWVVPETTCHKIVKFWCLRTLGTNSCFDIPKNDLSLAFIENKLKEFTLPIQKSPNTS